MGNIITSQQPEHAQNCYVCKLPKDLRESIEEFWLKGWNTNDIHAEFKDQLPPVKSIPRLEKFIQAHFDAFPELTEKAKEVRSMAVRTICERVFRAGLRRMDKGEVKVYPRDMLKCAELIIKADIGENYEEILDIALKKSKSSSEKEIHPPSKNHIPLEPAQEENENTGSF